MAENKDKIDPFDMLINRLETNTLAIAMITKEVEALAPGSAKRIAEKLRKASVPNQTAEWPKATERMAKLIE